MAKQYFLKRGKKVVGPMAAADLKRQVSNEKIIASDELSETERGPWKRVDAVPALRDLISPAEDEWFTDDIDDEFHFQAPGREETSRSNDDADDVSERFPWRLVAVVGGALAGLCVLITVVFLVISTSGVAFSESIKGHRVVFEGGEDVAWIEFKADGRLAIFPGKGFPTRAMGDEIHEQLSRMTAGSGLVDPFQGTYSVSGQDVIVTFHDDVWLETDLSFQFTFPNASISVGDEVVGRPSLVRADGTDTKGLAKHKTLEGKAKKASQKFMDELKSQQASFTVTDVQAAVAVVPEKKIAGKVVSQRDDPQVPAGRKGQDYCT